IFLVGCAEDGASVDGDDAAQAERIVHMGAVDLAVAAAPSAIDGRDRAASTPGRSSQAVSSPKAVVFSQAGGGGTGATLDAKPTLRYYTSADCSGSSTAYTTPDGTSLPISIGGSFGLVATSAWLVAWNQLSFADVTSVQSIAITLRSTNNSTPQAAITDANT